jgi:hypothetical protein
MTVFAPIMHRPPITDEMMWTLSETCVDDPISVLFPILHVLSKAC